MTSGAPSTRWVPSPEAPDVAVVILTFNEVIHLSRAIESVRPFAREIFVVDSSSTDGTQDLARRLGASVIEHPFVNQAKQFDWALETLPIKASWIMRLDADEIVHADLAEEIRVKLPGLPRDVAGITIDRCHIFLDKWIRHGGRFPMRLLRIWRTGQGRVEDRWMDEHVIVRGGRTVHFVGRFSDHNLNDLTYFTAKHNSYATREAVQVLIERYSLWCGEEGLSAQSTSRQAATRRFLKQRVFQRLPFWFSAAAYFLYRYFLQLGFLDGKSGLIYHFLQGAWYRFLVGSKIFEFERAMAGIADRDAKLRALANASGIRLAHLE